MSEAEVLRQIRLGLNAPGRVFWRNNVGVAEFPSGERVAYGVGGPGGSDLLGIVDGHFVAIEVKSARGRLTAEQKRFIDLVRRCGGRAGEARSVEDAIRIALGE